MHSESKNDGAELDELTSRTDSLLIRGDEDDVATEVAICTRFVDKTSRRVRRNAPRVDFETDAPLSEIAQAIYERGGYRAHQE